MSLFVGIDIGTQGIKLLAYDPERRHVAATASAALELISRDDGTREHQPRRRPRMSRPTARTTDASGATSMR